MSIWLISKYFLDFLGKNIWSEKWKTTITKNTPTLVPLSFSLEELWAVSETRNDIFKSQEGTSAQADLLRQYLFAL